MNKLYMDERKFRYISDSIKEINKDILVRNGSIDDYDEFLEAEEKAWQGSGVELISKNQYQNWLHIYPQGLLLATREGKICGHIFNQICEFNPSDSSDVRSWDEITDKGNSIRSHNPNGNCLYTVSFSASSAGAGKILASQGLEDAKKAGLKYYAGACRMPGLTKFANKNNTPITPELVEMYVNLVTATSEKRNTESKIFDPTLSILLRTKGLKFYRVIADYFQDPQSDNWAAVVAWENPELK